MSNTETIERLENQLDQLIDGMLHRKGPQVDFLIQLNRLDDIIIDCTEKRPIEKNISAFMADNRSWFEGKVLTPVQKKRAGKLIAELYNKLIDSDDINRGKLSDEIKELLKAMGNNSFRVTLKRPEENTSLTDRYRLLLHKEVKELTDLLESHDHILTCLDDLIKSAKVKSDGMYRHMAASLIYFLQMEGYKIDPYLKKLREL